MKYWGRVGFRTIKNQDRDQECSYSNYIIIIIIIIIIPLKAFIALTTVLRYRADCDYPTTSCFRAAKLVLLPAAATDHHCSVSSLSGDSLTSFQCMTNFGEGVNSLVDF